MQFTANLNLKKPDGTDVVNITDLNDNATILDAEITKKATQTADGRMSKEDKTKLDGVQAGAQANTVTSVAGKTGAVVLVGTDVPQATTSARGTVQLTNGLASTSTTTALTAAQGKVLKDLVDAKAGNTELISLNASLTAHLAEDDEHNRFIDGTTKYKYRFKPNAAKDGLIFVYEEVV